MTHQPFAVCASALLLVFGAMAGPVAMAQSGADGGPAAQEELNIQVDAGVTRDDNLTRANLRADRVADNAAFFSVGKTFNYALGEHDRLVLGMSVGGERFRRVDRLNRAHVGGEIEYQYRASSDFDEPTYGAFLKLTAEDFESRQRDGNRTAIGLSLRRTLTDRINLYAALSHNRRNARNEVFSSSENALRANLDVLLTDRALLYLGAEYRRGDIVSTGWPMMNSAGVSNVWAMDDAFPGMLSYRLRGSTTLVTLGFNYALAHNQSVDLSWRYIQARPKSSLMWTGIDTSYRSSQLSLAYLYRF